MQHLFVELELKMRELDLCYCAYTEESHYEVKYKPGQEHDY